MNCFRSIMVTLVAIAIVCALASFASADFWANDGDGPGGQMIKKYNTDGTYAGISIDSGTYDIRKLGYYNGYVYAIDTSAGSVRRWSNVDGALDTAWSISAVQPFGMGFDSVGKLYLCVLNNSNGQGDELSQVVRYNREAGTADGWTTSGYAIYQPGAVALDSAGKVYVADGPRGIIERFNADGTFDKIFAQYHDLNNPTCLTFDAAGRLYTGNWGNNLIQRWLADGTFDGTLTGYTNYANHLGFQGDQLMCKYGVYGTFGCIPGDTVGGVISGTWLGTADSKEDWGFRRQGMAVVPVTPTNGWITLQVDFQDFAGDKALVPVKIELYKNEVAVGDPRIVFLESDSYIWANLSPGTDYRVAVSGAKWLRRSEPVTVVAGQGTNRPVSLKNGDMDGDNQVNSSDLSILLRNFDAIGD